MLVSREPHSFLGLGWSFPPEFSPDGSVVMTSDVADIEASLRILLGTTQGERFLNPDFGLDLHALVFEPLSTTATHFLADQVRLRLLIFEPRINVLSVDIRERPLTQSDAQGIMEISIDYVINSTNSRFNLVYPFYQKDANEARSLVARTASLSPATR